MKRRYDPAIHYALYCVWYDGKIYLGDHDATLKGAREAMSIHRMLGDGGGEPWILYPDGTTERFVKGVRTITSPSNDLAQTRRAGD